MKRINKLLTIIVMGAFICTMFSACGQNSNQEATQASDSELVTMETVAKTVDDVTQPATFSDTPVEFTFVIDTTINEGGTIKETKAKAAGSLGDYVRSLDNCVWEDGPYGLFVHSFDGAENDDSKGIYWSYYINDEYAMTTADDTPLVEGYKYTWKLEASS